MQYASVSSSDLVKYNRMDAGFHVARDSVKARTFELEAKISKEEVIERLGHLKTEDLMCLEPLTTGNKAPDRAGLLKAISQYPHIAYALVEKNADEIEKRAAAAAEEVETYKNAASRLRI